MGERRELGVVQPLDPPGVATQRRGQRSPWRALLVLVAVLSVSGAVLRTIPADVTPRGVDPLLAVRTLRDALDGGVADEVVAAMSEEAILTWPSGPPWGGPLSWSVELHAGGSAEPLSQHIAALDDYLAFHHALNGTTELNRCQVRDSASIAIPWRFDSLVICSFSIQNDLLSTLDAEAPVPVGRMRFTVTDGKISAVLVDSWEVTYPPFEYLRWIKAERPESFDTVFAGRWTEPRYSADAAFALLDLATEFAATAS